MTGPRKRASRTVELANLPDTSLPADGGVFEKTPTEERRDVELEEILGEMGTDGRIKVWQVVDGKSSYAGEISVDGFSLDVLLDTFGGGDKSLAIYQGKHKRETIRVSLDPSIPPRNPRMPRAVANGAASAGPGIGDIANVLTTMATMNMQSMSQSQQMMTAMVTAMTGMMSARPAEKDPMDMALRMAELMKAGQQPAGAGNVAEMFSVLERGMNIGKSINGGKEDDGIMSVVGEGMKTLGVLVDGIVTEKKAKALAGVSVATGAPPALPDVARGVAPVNPPEAGAYGSGGDLGPGAMTVRPWVDAVRPHIGKLLSVARFVPPSAAAETISKNLTDDQFFDLTDDIMDQSDGGFGPRLLRYFPEVADVDPEWIGKLVDVIITEYIDAPDDEPQEPPMASGSGTAT